jgi:hypothetical protein
MVLKSGIPGAALTVPLVLACLLSAGCQQEAPEVPQEEVARAQAALQPFKEQLLSELVEALREGPTNAISVCRQRSPEIAAEQSVGGVRMGRTSHRLRNPDNAPQPWMEPLLAAYLEEPGNGQPQAVWLDESTFGYVEPIHAKSFCLSCHGPRVETALLEEIRSLYPEDQAIDFRDGDLRGMFWITMPHSS